MRVKKCISAVLAAALVLTALPVDGINRVQAAGTQAQADVQVDATVRALPEDASTFNDTDNDGLGEFQGWGTSLCWWANRLGYDETLTNEAAAKFFGDEGLDLNIGRYNVGGGDNTYIAPEIPEVPVNPKAKIYGVTPEDGVLSYAGTEMKIQTESRFKDAQYTSSDADFGFTKGKNVGEFRYVGYVNKLSDAVGTGDKLHYTVNADAANYTVKLLAYHNANLSRDIAIKVNDDKEYVISAEDLKNNMIAKSTSDNKGLFLATFKNVPLNQGANKIDVAGKDDWSLDFLNMLIVKSGEEGVLPEEPKTPEGKFLHPAHIKRSDSDMPGYWTDVTEIDKNTYKTEAAAKEAYKDFARVDYDCGFAWNYDWTKDNNQMNILKAAKKASGTDFIAEAFSNSPPYFMTNSGCSSGAVDSSQDNLRADSYDAFAAYMADVIVHWAEEGVVDFQSTTPMNEPDTSYWGANSNKQEGCHFDPGTSQSNIIVALNAELKKQAAASTNANVKRVLNNIIICGTDETDIDKSITNYNKLSTEAKNVITRIDTHTYSGSKRAELSELAKKEGKNLWMSEIDGTFKAGTDAGEMTAALGFAKRIMEDVNGFKCTAWIIWNAVDTHVDANNPFDKNSLEELKTTHIDGDENKDFLYNPNSAYWGIAIGDHNNKELVLTRKYYAYGQFSKYIRPGYTIIGTSDEGNTLIAYDKAGKKVVIVAVNTAGTDKTWKFDLSRFTSMGSITAHRTSGAIDGGESWADLTADQVNAVSDAAGRSFTADMKANSITTFVVDNVELDKEKAEEEAKREAALKEMQKEVLSAVDMSGLNLTSHKISLTEGMLTSSAPWNNGTTDVAKNILDGDFGTFFDGVSDGYVQFDLGEGNAKVIAAYGYAPRSGYESRCVGASLYGSNDGKNWELLHTIKSVPSAGKLSYAYMNEFDSVNVMGKAYRYYKYAVDSSGNCNIAEFELYEKPADVSVPTLPSTVSDWAAYCEGKTEGRNYQETSKAKFDAALKAAKELPASATTEQKEKAQQDLFEAYLALREIIVYDSISGVDGAALQDDVGEIIQAHGGQVQKITYDYDYDGNGSIGDDEHEFWYWVGEDKTNDYRPCPGVRAYISKDLYNWKDMGNVLKTVANWETFTTDKYFTDLYGDLTEEQKKAVYADIWTDNDAVDSGCVIERPKMIYNDTTKQYVIWFHADGQTPDSSGGNYAKAKAGVAVSSSPFGPFKMQGSYLLNYAEGVKGVQLGFDSEGGHVRDMNLFKDDDGTAYVLYSSNGNRNMYISKLNDTYTNIAKTDAEGAVEGVDYTVNFVGESREAPAMFKYNGKYYLITSGCTGWGPNPAKYATADSPLGPWTQVGDPCSGEDANITYATQSTCVIPVDPANGKFIYMGDRWYNPEVTQGPGAGGSLRDSRYVWLPITFQSGNRISIKRVSNWKLENEFKTGADKTELYQLINEAAKKMTEQENYTAASWDAFNQAFKSAQNVQLNAYATQDAIDKAKTGLQEGLDQLTTIMQYFADEIAANSVDEADKDYYTEDSWEIYETVLSETKELLEENLSEEEVEDALKILQDAVSVLELKDKTGPKKQTIQYKKSYVKVQGDKAFNLNAKVTSGGGELSYKTSNKNVAAVNSAGKVTIKGCGSCTITITAAETKWYQKTSVTVTVTVNPKKVVVSSVKPAKGGKLIVKWKADKTVTGYEIQCSLKKDFKKIAAKATVKKAKTASTTLKKLAKNKRYYVRVRAYKTVKVGKKSKNFVGAWSSLKRSAKIK